MTVVTIRPDSTPFSNGSLTGAATVHAALSDDSDSSYFRIGSAPGFWTCGFANPTFPAGSLLASIALRLRCSIDNTPKQYTVQLNGASGPWGSPPVSSTLTVSWMTPTTLTIAPAELAGLATPVADVNLDSVQASVARIGSGLDVYLKSYEAYLDLTVVEQPAVTAEAPTGTVTTTNLPQVAWTNTLDSDGGAQAFYQVKIFNQAQYSAGGFNPATATPVLNSTVLSGETGSWTPTATLPDGTYRAYVRTAQSVNGAQHWSDWAYTGFEIDVALPAVPLIVVTDDPANGRLEITLDDQAGAATTDAFELQRSLDGGLTWEPVRLDTDTAGIIDGTAATAWDWEAANGQTVIYRARALHDYSGVYAASDWATDTGAWESGTWWLKNPILPALNTPITVHSQAGYQRPARRGVFQPIGGRHAIAITDTRAADTGQLVLRVDTDEQIQAIDALLDSGDVLLIQGTPGDHWTDRYVTVGDLDRARLVDKAFIEGTVDTLAWTETDSPDGPLVWDEPGS